VDVTFLKSPGTIFLGSSNVRFVGFIHFSLEELTMADSDDMDWGDDPFMGDLDFDDDFDKPASNKGFLRSAATGFLSGLVGKTIGDTDARINTLKMVLPRSYLNAFSNLRVLNDRRKEVMDEIKGESYQAVQDLQYLAQRAAKKLGKGTPNRISDGLMRFSEHDFSDWEKTDYSPDDRVRMDGLEDSEVSALLSNEDANSKLEQEAVERVGETTISMMSEIGGRQIGSMNTVNRGIVRGNQLLEQLLDHQRRVKSRNDAMQLNILARTYLTNAKFYKFVEASNHKIIDVLKDIGKYSQMSDYEKTSHSQAIRKSIRESVFSSAKEKFGGIRDFITERFGKDARENGISTGSDIISTMRMAAEMTEGSDINLGDMLGNAAAGIFINNLPRMINSDRGQTYLARFKKQFPQFSKWATDAYKRIEDLGHVASYVTGNAEGLVNTMARHYQGDFDLGAFDTYEDYKDQLPEGQKPLSKIEWKILNGLKKAGNTGIEALMSNMYTSDGSRYSMQARTLSDSYEQQLWTRQSDRTLNETLPMWLSQIHLAIEKFRTGNDSLQAASYDYVKGKFISHDQKVANVTSQVLDRHQFKGQAEAATRLAEQIDMGNALSPEAKRELAYRLIRDTDADAGFNPYNYMKFDEDDMNPKIAAEIKRVMQGNFGISNEHLDKFNNGSDVDRMTMLGYMPSEKGRERLARISESASSLADFMPDIVSKLDILKTNGNYDALKESGIVKANEYGRDDINQELIWDTVKQFLADPERRSALMPADQAPLASRAFGGGAAPADTGGRPLLGPDGLPAPLKVDGMDKLTESLGGMDTLKTTLNSLNENLARGPQTPIVDMLPLSKGIDTLNEQVKSLLELAQGRNDILTKILERQPSEKNNLNKDQEKELKQQKRSIIDRLKNTSFKDIFNNGMDKLLDHEPLILGGLLGGLATVAFHNPHAAALIGGGAAAAVVYGKIRSLAMARNPEDNEDLYEEGSDVPILEANKLANKNYYDATKGYLITSWKQISGSVKDISNDTIIGARRLSGKLFTKENKEVFLKGLDKVRDLMTKAFHVLDPFGRMGRMKDRIVNRFFQMDVYKEGADSPTLLGKSFAGGAYYKKDESGKPVQLNGWNDIDGPVYDREGNVLITQEEYDRGLRTSMGVSVNKLGAASRKFSDATMALMRKVRDKAAPAFGVVKDKVVAAVKADYTPIITSVDRIYHLMLKHWGYQMELVTGDAPPPPPPLQSAPAPTPQPTPQPEPEVVTTKGKKGKKKKVVPEVAPVAGIGVVPPEEVARREEKESSHDKHSFAALIKEKFSHEDNPNRLNSAEDQKEKKAQKKDDAAKEALVDIAGAMGVGKDAKGKKKPGVGLFSLLASGIGGLMSVLGGISSFFTKTLWGSMKTLTSFAMIGLRTLPKIASGIGILAKGIFTLLKTRSVTSAGESIMDGIRGTDGSLDHETNRKRRAKRTPRGRVKGGGLKVGAGLAVGMAADSLVDYGVIDEGGAVDTVADVAGTAATVYGGYQLATGVAAMAGVDIGVGALAGGAATVGAAGWGAMVAGAGMLAPLVLNPWVLGALAVGAVGYGIYRYVTRGEGKQTEMRLAQYGISDPDSDLAKKVLQLEAQLLDFVVIGNGRASLTSKTPIEEIIKAFVPTPGDKREMGSVFSWFNGRFKPVFLTYMACLDVVKIKSLKEYDEAKTQEVYQVAKQTHAALGSIMPYPYSIVAKIDKDTPILGEKATIIKVNNLLDELKAYTDRKTDREDLVSITTPKSAESLQKEKSALEAQLADPKKAFGGDKDPGGKRLEAQKRLKEVDGQIQALNSSYKVSASVQQIYIKDLLPENRAMDLMTAIRVACYGNDQDTTWRVEAVLKLERYCEPLFVVNGDKVEFKGQIGDLFGIFKESFRLDKDDADDWCMWFRDRFIPVMSTYVQALQQYRRGQPGVVWKTLSVTARYEISRALIDTKVTVGLFTVSVWRVKASPFKDSFSADKGDRVDRMLKLLGEASVTAKLQDPEKEAGKTSAQEWAKEISPRKVGGGYQEHAANVQDVSKAKNSREVALGGMYGTNSTRGAGTGNTYDMAGSYTTPTSKYGYKPLNGDSDTSHLDMTGVQANEGNDTGVKVPKKLAEQLIIREMLKQGVTDPRAIAEMLAHTNVESGSYGQTVENMKYSSPERLVKMFKEVTNIEQARQLVSAGEVAIANTVYGGAKGQSLGNNAPGDGWKYRGRGFVHITGKANYAKIGEQLGIDLVNKPELASTDPNVMAAIAVNFYKNSKALQSITQTGDFGQAAAGMNGNGNLPEMSKRYALYLDYLKQLESGSLAANEAGAESTTNAPEAGTQTASGMYGSPSSAPGASGGGAPAPMIGRGGTPSMGTAPGGGSTNASGYGTPNILAPGGGGSYGGGGASGEYDGGGSLVNSNASSSGGLRLKSSESIAGGKSHPGIEALCRIIQSRVPNFKQFTALNDAYHQRKPGNSRHKSGLAADFTLTNGIQGSDVAVRVVTEIMGQAGLTNADYGIINEYRKLSANGTGGHVHVHFKTPAGADKYLAAAGGAQDGTGQDTTAGGMVQEMPDKGQPVPQPEESGGYTPPVEAPAAQAKPDPNKDYTGMPLPGGNSTTNNPQGPVGGPGAQAQAPAQPASTQSAPTQRAAPAPQAEPQQNVLGNAAMEGMAEALAQAMKEPSNQNNVLLKAILDKLDVIAKNGAAPQKAVSLD
jgi:predicted chitinase